MGEVIAEVSIDRIIFATSTFTAWGTLASTAVMEENITSEEIEGVVMLCMLVAMIVGADIMVVMAVTFTTGIGIITKPLPLRLEY
jgi:hypothetical protein